MNNSNTLSSHSAHHLYIIFVLVIIDDTSIIVNK